MGTMRERSPGSWELTVSAGVDPTTGRYARVIRTVRGTKREARSALHQLEVEVANGQVGVEDPTVAELLEPVAGACRGPRAVAGDALQLPAVRDEGAGPGHRLATAVEAHRGPPGPALLRAAPAGPGSGDDPPDPRHHAGGAAPGRPLGPRVAECCVVGIRAVAAAAGAASADRRRGHGADRALRRRWSRCSGSSSEWSRPPACGAARPVGCGGATSTWTAGRLDSAAQPSGAAGRGGGSPDQDPLRPHRDARPGDGGRVDDGVAGGSPSGSLRRHRRRHGGEPATSSASTPTARPRGGVTPSPLAGSAPAEPPASRESACMTCATGRPPSCSTPAFPSRRWRPGSATPTARRR